MRPESEPVSLREVTWVAVAGFLTVFFARAWLVRAWGSPVPYWDQWDAEATALYLPWQRGELRWTDLFAAHNEHRVVLTRLADLALLALRGGWDVWGQLLLNAALHAATAAALLAVFHRAVDRHARPAFATALVALFLLPAGWQNALWGFQSQVYFSNALAVAAAAGLAAPGWRPWCAGCVAALLALGGNASGVFAAAAALVVLAPEARHSATARLRLALLAAVVAAGLAFTGKVPAHAALHVHSAAQFFAVFARALAWPWVNQPWLGLVVPLPLLVLAWRRRRTGAADVAERAAFMLGLVALLHAAAIAWSRGAGLIDARPLSRYQDPLLLGVAAQLFALFRLWRELPAPARLAGLCWSGLMLAGAVHLSTTNLTVHAPFRRMQDQASLGMIRNYFATHDPRALDPQPPLIGPHPQPETVRRLLDDPQLVALLPEALRAPEGELAATAPAVIRYAPWELLAAGAFLGVALWRAGPRRAQTGRTAR